VRLELRSFSHVNYEFLSQYLDHCLDVCTSSRRLHFVRRDGREVIDLHLVISIEEYPYPRFALHAIADDGESVAEYACDLVVSIHGRSLVLKLGKYHRKVLAKDDGESAQRNVSRKTCGIIWLLRINLVIKIS
jgi:hypothetical protein